MKRGLLALAVVAIASPARAEDRATYVHAFATLAAGEALRFNNPYRLPTQLGKTPESVSLAAPYGDLGLGATLGAPSGLQHGALVHWSFALGGIRQSVVTPSYVALLRLGAAMPYARAGLPFVVGPDPNVGGELALGGIYLFSGAVGVTGELGGSAFYGAATREVSATFVPLLFLQLGVAVDLEALP